MEDKVCISNGFIRDVDGWWISLRRITGFFVDDAYIKCNVLDESDGWLIKGYDSNVEAQNELDKMMMYL